MQVWDGTEVRWLVVLPDDTNLHETVMTPIQLEPTPQSFLNNTDRDVPYTLLSDCHCFPVSCETWSTRAHSDIFRSFIRNPDVFSSSMRFFRQVRTPASHMCGFTPKYPSWEHLSEVFSVCSEVRAINPHPCISNFFSAWSTCSQCSV